MKHLALVVMAAVACSDPEPAPPEIGDVLIDPPRALLPNERLRVDVVVESELAIADARLYAGGTAIALFEQIAASAYRAEVSWDTLVRDDLKTATGGSAALELEMRFADRDNRVAIRALGAAVGCGDTRALCGRTCRDLASDVDHCGACDAPAVAAGGDTTITSRSCTFGMRTAVARKVSATPETCTAICANLTDGTHTATCAARCDAPGPPFFTMSAGGGLDASLTLYQSPQVVFEGRVESCFATPLALLVLDGRTYTHASHQCCCVVERP